MARSASLPYLIICGSSLADVVRPFFVCFLIGLFHGFLIKKLSFFFFCLPLPLHLTPPHPPSPDVMFFVSQGTMIDKCNIQCCC
jgi:hypothetical protein